MSTDPKRGLHTPQTSKVVLSSTAGKGGAGCPPKKKDQPGSPLASNSVRREQSTLTPSVGAGGHPDASEAHRKPESWGSLSDISESLSHVHF